MLAEFNQRSQIVVKIMTNRALNFHKTFEFGGVQKCGDLKDLDKCCCTAGWHRSVISWQLWDSFYRELAGREDLERESPALLRGAQRGEDEVP